MSFAANSDDYSGRDRLKSIAERPAVVRLIHLADRAVWWGRVLAMRFAEAIISGGRELWIAMRQDPAMRGFQSESVRPSPQGLRLSPSDKPPPAEAILGEETTWTRATRAVIEAQARVEHVHDLTGGARRQIEAASYALDCMVDDLRPYLELGRRRRYSDSFFPEASKPDPQVQPFAVPKRRKRRGKPSRAA